ncbi:MAG: hypothetical protein DSY58_09415 [Desulfobulbus sp.]|nr:MAG: hypothetical protein DSY58_09415 [Desulfobulbus sp.]
MKHTMPTPVGSEDNQFSEIFQVTPADCISAIDDSLPSLLGTYILVKWMEIVSAKNSNRQLDDRHLTVGERITIEHTGMAVPGEDVTILSVLERQEKRKIYFRLEAVCKGKTIATGTHKRAVLPLKILKRMMADL